MSGGENLESLLRAIVDVKQTWVSIGTIQSIETHVSFGYLLNITLQPSGKLVQARYVSIGAQSSEGAYWPVAVGDEMLVLFPRADTNQSVALGPLNSRAAAVPSDWSNSNVVMTQANGFQFRVLNGNLVEPVVKESLLPDLLGSLTEVQTILNALGVPTPTTTQFLTNLATQYRSQSVETD